MLFITMPCARQKPKASGREINKKKKRGEQAGLSDGWGSAISRKREKLGPLKH